MTKGKRPDITKSKGHEKTKLDAQLMEIESIYDRTRVLFFLENDGRPVLGKASFWYFLTAIASICTVAIAIVAQETLLQVAAFAVVFVSMVLYGKSYAKAVSGQINWRGNWIFGRQQQYSAKQIFIQDTDRFDIDEIVGCIEYIDHLLMKPKLGFGNLAIFFVTSVLVAIAVNIATSNFTDIMKLINFSLFILLLFLSIWIVWIAMTFYQKKLKNIRYWLNEVHLLKKNR